MKIYIIIVSFVTSLIIGLLLWEKPVENNRDTTQYISETQGGNTMFSEVETQLTTQEILYKLDEEVDIIKPEIILEEESEIIKNTKLINISEIINVMSEERNTQCVKKDILSELDSLISDHNEENSQSCNLITHEDIQTNEIEIKPQPEVITVKRKEKIISDEVTIIRESNISELKEIVGNERYDIHIDFESMSKSQELLQKLAQDKYVFSVNHYSVIMPIFLKDKDKILNLKRESEFQILQQLENGISHIPIDDEEDDNEENNQPIIISQPDFQPHEYFRNSANEAPQVYHYEVKPEWLIPEGNPEDFSLDKRKISNAYGINYKFIAFSLKNKYIETEIGMLEGMTTFLKQYISQDFYFVGDNEEESGYRTIHVNVSSYPQSQELMKKLKFDPKIGTVRNRSYLLPEFHYMEKEINEKHAEYSIFTIDKLME